VAKENDDASDILAQPSSILQHLEALNATSFFVSNQSPEDVRWASTSETKAKRVLSSNTLKALNAEAGRDVDSPKRLRPSLSKPKLFLPELSLGIAALDTIMQPLPRQLEMRDPSIMSSDDEDLDKRLSEELDRNASDSSRENSPVPLLTPPQSPLTICVEGEDGEDTVTVCEWPWNVVVDSAMLTVATELRPMSPDSLQRFEQDEEERVSIQHSFKKGTEASTLTPLLRSIYVGID
jgi:hypothetical protein